MADAQRIEILVDSDVSVAAEGTPRTVLDALKRQLRQHQQSRLLRHDGSERALLNLLQTAAGQHRLPQGLLSRVTETCRRHGVPYSVVDRRAMVSCAALRSRLRLDERQTKALRRLLLHDSGVLVAPQSADRLALAAELLSRHQQRALLLTERRSDAIRWRDSLADAFGVEAPFACLLDGVRDESRVIVGTYSDAAAMPQTALERGFGMLVFDGIDRVDPVTLMRTVRRAAARYLLGLAHEATRPDGLHEPLFLALGGVVTQLQPASTQNPLQLLYRPHTTAFDFPYGGRAEYQALLAALARDEPRNRLIVDDLQQQVAAGQTCLVLSERRDHIEALLDLLPPDLDATAITSAIRPAERKERAARLARGELRVVLATSQVALEALTSPRLDCLLISFPFSYTPKLQRLVQQMLQPAPDKRQAVVIDYDDARIAPLHRAFEKRAKLLARLQRNAERLHRDWAQLRLDLE